MFRHTLKILQHLLQNFQSVPDHFGKLYIKGLRILLTKKEEKKRMWIPLKPFVKPYRNFLKNRIWLQIRMKRKSQFCATKNLLSELQ